MQKQLCGPAIHSRGLGFQSQMAGFLGVISDFYGFVRFGKENKCRVRAGLLAAAGANAHSAMAPGRVSRVARHCWLLLPLEKGGKGRLAAPQVTGRQVPWIEHGAANQSPWIPGLALPLTGDMIFFFFVPPDLSEFQSPPLQNRYNIHIPPTLEDQVRL